MNTIKVNISDVKTNPNNPRVLKDDKFKKLVNSIKGFPQMLEIRPIVVNNDMIVLGGNMRLKACKEAGLKEVYIIKADQLTADQQREFIIKDNVGFGEWDWDMIANEWDTEEIEAWGLDVPVFDEPEELEAEEDDYEMPEQMNVDVVPGDLIEIGGHRLLCGDSTDSDQVAKLMNGNKADMVFTDPPYGVSYEGGHNTKKRKGIENDTLQNKDLSNLFTDSLNTACIFTQDYAPFYIWYASGKSVETFEGLGCTPLEVRAIVCWYKVNSGLGAFMAQYIPNYEPCIYAHKIGQSIKWYGPTDEKTIWELKNDQKNKFHPTQKPVELPERAINNSSKVEDIIYDCFLGSGSTMVASHQLKRKCYGMELDPKYCQVIIDRMMQLDDSLEVKINGNIYNGNTEK